MRDDSDVGPGIRARALLASAVLAAVIGSTFAVLVFSIDELRADVARERRSEAVLIAANRLERLIVDLETGLRGFVITGAERFLEPYHAARSALPDQTSRLEQLVAENPEQEARSRRIADAAAAYLNEYAIPLVRTARQNLRDAGTIAATEEGKQRVDALRAAFDRFVDTERLLSASRRDASDTTARRAIIAASAGVIGSIALAILFSAYLARLIIGPVRALAQTAQRIARGDLHARTHEVGVAEIGVLGRSFNTMAASVERSQAELTRIAEEQSALRRVATLVAKGVSPEVVFAAVSEEVGRLFGADSAHMVRVEPDGTVSGIAGWSEEGESIPIGAHVSLEGESVTASVLRSGGPARMESYAEASGPIAESLRSMGFRSSVGSPIIVDGRVWGIIIVSSKSEVSFPAEIESRLQAFTELVATAISNAHASAELTASRARIVAAGDDARRRIERDLHDGAQQRLVSLGLELRGAEIAVPAEHIGLKEQLSQIAEGLDSVLEELREISRGIHPAILSQGGLGPALKALARRSPIPVELDVRVDSRLSEHVEVAAYYTASEAMTNAVKHADASIASISLATRGDMLVLSVADDGAGGADPTRGSGLVGLRDRIEALGGRFEVTSPIGKGTTITVELPAASD
jgi:signal transduction histidine kinase/CHASE3 domain sensor protein